MDTYIRAVIFLSRVAGVFSAILIGLAVLVICDMVIVRYFLSVPTIWQIDAEIAVPAVDPMLTADP